MTPNQHHRDATVTGCGVAVTALSSSPSPLHSPSYQPGHCWLLSFPVPDGGTRQGVQGGCSQQCNRAGGGRRSPARSRGLRRTGRPGPGYTGPHASLQDVIFCPALSGQSMVLKYTCDPTSSSWPPAFFWCQVQPRKCCSRGSPVLILPPRGSHL